MRAVFVYHGQYEGSLSQSVPPPGGWAIDLLPTNGPPMILDVDLIVFAPMAFNGHEGSEHYYLRHRETQVALRNGKSVVFLTHKALVQNPAHELIAGYLREVSLTMIWINPLLCVPTRTEFAEYCDKYGHAGAVFQGPTNILRPGADSISNVATLMKAGDRPAGIAFRSKQGLIYCLPFQLASLDVVNWNIFFATLLSAISDYTAATKYFVPDWLRSVQLPPEIPLIQKISDLEQSLKSARDEWSNFDIYKATLVAKGDALVDATAQVLTTLLGDIGYRIVREERFVEDLWLDREGAHKVIVEVKGTDGNVGRRHINDLDSHRESYLERGQTGITANSPALLVANTFANAGDIAGKDQEIHPDVIKHAVESRVLVTRTLDLFRLLELKMRSRVGAADISTLLLGRIGWLRVTDEPRIVE
jgi:hypothetical protein